MIRIEVLPAAFGDCLLVEYGKPKKESRILIDAGLVSTYKSVLKPRLAKLSKAIAKKKVPLELLVVTHIDRDHICGVLPLLEASPAVVEADEIWFNGYKHLSDGLGVEEGEALGNLLDGQAAWNRRFRGKAVVVPEKGKLPEVKLPGGAVLTLLSPYRSNLTALEKVWKSDRLGSWAEPNEPPPSASEPDDVLGKRPPLTSIDEDSVRELAEEPDSEDKTKPNGSSIAFLFEYAGKRVLFGADAHPSMLLRSLERHSPKARVKVDAFKLSHHGSMSNLSNALLDKVDCPRFLVSSSGASFGHPHPETLARIVTRRKTKKTLCFNYASGYTLVWDEAAVRKAFNYDVAYPESDKSGFVLDLR